jgi:hypothetical protein
MASFSKQWCELNDPDMPYDFDIFEEFKYLAKNAMVTPVICEGFGFIAISRDEDDRCLLAFRDNDGYIMWEDYDQFMDRYINRNNKIKTTDLKNTSI